MSTRKGKKGMKEFQAQRKGTSGLHLLLGTVLVGIVLAVLLEVIVQVLPPHYSPISQSESDLAVGPYGFLMAINFVIRGLLTLIFVVAFVRAVPKEAQSRIGLILLTISGLGKLILAFVATDLTARPHTIHGAIHALVAVVSFFCGALGIFLLALALRHVPQMRPSPRFLLGLASITLAWSVIVIGTIVISSQIGVWGLFERIFDGLFYLWILIASLGLWHFPSLEET
jgi:Protein of unknown function (DUF998)